MSNKNIIKVTDVVGPLCISADDGQMVHDCLAKFLQNESQVAVSFNGVKTIISAFLNAAIGQLYGEFSEEEIRKYLSVDGLEQEDLALLKRVVDNAKIYFQNQKQFDAAWKSEVNDEE